MYKKELNGVINTLITIVGIVFSVFNITTTPLMFIFYALFICVVILFRTKYFWLPIISLIGMAYVFFNNLMFAMGYSIGFEMPNFMTIIFIVFNICAFTFYCSYNAYTLYNKTKITNKKIA